MMKTISKEKILEVEHEILMGVNPWDYSEQEKCTNFAFYYSGVIDMASVLLSMLEEEQ